MFLIVYDDHQGERDVIFETDDYSTALEMEEQLQKATPWFVDVYIVFPDPA